MNIVNRIKCPVCDDDKFQQGPRGGAAMNIRCICGHELNVARLPDGRFLVEDITSRSL